MHIFYFTFLVGEFGSKCTKDVGKTAWLHKNTCDCEKKTLVEYFKEKVGFRSFLCFALHILTVHKFTRD